jgi:hypothetical protein
MHELDEAGLEQQVSGAPIFSPAPTWDDLSPLINFIDIANVSRRLGPEMAEGGLDDFPALLHAVDRGLFLQLAIRDV